MMYARKQEAAELKEVKDLAESTCCGESLDPQSDHTHSLPHSDDEGVPAAAPAAGCILPPPGLEFPPGLRQVTTFAPLAAPSLFPPTAVSDARAKYRENGQSVLVNVQSTNQRRAVADGGEGKSSGRRRHKNGGRINNQNQSGRGSDGAATGSTCAAVAAPGSGGGGIVAAERHAALLQVFGSWGNEQQRAPQALLRRPLLPAAAVLPHTGAMRAPENKMYYEPMKVPVSEFFNEVMSL